MKHVPLLLLFAVATYSSTAFGWGGTLNAPLFGYADGLDANRQKKAQAALTFMHEELKFIDGEFISVFVTNRFGGTAQQTSRFIELLKESKAWKVRVQFQDFGEQESAFMLFQNMAGDTVEVTVNSGREDFRLKDFQAHLPSPPHPAKAKQPAKK